ncbi:hypothetical protein ACFSJ3_06610 [Corallincola platygyrae]|uniref:Uncharacterized protein n=1 Tax=Corallincola platygyrae TaxID=1193278 RepID=A0ABW4XJB9_9GAMM
MIIEKLAIGSTLLGSVKNYRKALCPFEVVDHQDTAIKARLHRIFDSSCDNKTHTQSLLNQFRVIVTPYLESEGTLIIYMDPLPMDSITEAGMAEYQALKQVLPEIASHKKCYLFPYGRASFPASFQSLNKNEESIQILSISSALAFTPQKTVSMIQNDAVCIARLGGGESLKIRWSKSGYAKDAVQLKVVLKGLFLDYVDEVDLPIDLLTLDCNGHEDYLNAFAETVRWLGSVMYDKTQVELMDYQIGDLRSINGLLQYTTPKTGTRLHLCMAETGIIAVYVRT